MIYLDYAANTPAEEAVLRRFCEVERAYIANPNASHAAGREAAQELARVTESIAALLGARPEEVVLTSGASEANNLAIKGIARMSRHVGRHIVSTALEHPSVSACLTALQEQGYEIDLADIGRDGRIDTGSLRELLRRDTVLLAMTLVDSELGTVQPAEEIAAILKEYPACRLHIDATQAAGKIPFSFAGADTMTLAPHKFGGLNGSGILLRRQGLVLEPLIHGGTGASAERSGTPALALAASAQTALELALAGREEHTAAVAGLSAWLKGELLRYPGVRVNSPAGAVPHIVNLSVAGVRGEAFAQALSEQGVCVSVKSACSVRGTPSKAVFAVSRDRKNALSSWRVSLSHRTTRAELSRFMEAFERCYKELVK